MKQFLLLIAVLCLNSCKSKKEEAYQPPAHLSEDQKKDFIERYRKGKILYAANCASCHNKTKNGITTELQATAFQLDNYAKGQTDAHDHKFASKGVRQEDLMLVVFYITHKKKKG